MDTDVLNMGYLEGNTTNNNTTLVRGSKLRLPLWMVQSLHDEHYGTMDLPQQYGRRFGSAINAGAKVRKGCLEAFFQPCHLEPYVGYVSLLV